MNGNLCIEFYGVVFKFCCIYCLLVHTSVSAMLFVAMNSTGKNASVNENVNVKMTVLMLENDGVNVRARRYVRVDKNSVRDACFRFCVRPRNAE